MQLAVCELKDLATFPGVLLLEEERRVALIFLLLAVDSCLAWRP
jgi:hypothetical protein